MKVLEPLTTQWSPSRTAVVFSMARSDPPDGSVIAILHTSSPAAMPGSHRAFCSSVPNSRMYGGQVSACRARHAATPRLNPAISSVATALWRKSPAPVPPDSPGGGKPGGAGGPALVLVVLSSELAG